MPRRLRKIKKLSLYRALKLGYLKNEQKQAKRLKRFGYVLDADLTDNQHLVARNAFNGKILYVNNGSESNPLNTGQFLKDWRTDLMNVTTGTFDYTPRAQQDKSTYLKIKQKYGEQTPVKFIGHSLGGVSINELTKKGDTGITYNAPLFTKTKDNPNVTNVRTANDLVSAFQNPKDSKTIQSGSNQNFIQAHNIENIKQLPVFI